MIFLHGQSSKKTRCTTSYGCYFFDATKVGRLLFGDERKYSKQVWTLVGLCIWLPCVPMLVHFGTTMEFLKNIPVVAHDWWRYADSHSTFLLWFVTDLRWNKVAPGASMVYIWITKTESMPRQSITFTTPNDEWLNAQVSSREYNSKSEVINDLIRRARAEQEQIEYVRARLKRAEDSGFTDLSAEEIRQEVRNELGLNGWLHS